MNHVSSAHQSPPALLAYTLRESKTMTAHGNDITLTYEEMDKRF
jgi:hypothetical protein